MTEGGFGAGSAFTILPISAMIKSSGYESTFLYFGIGQGIVVVVLSLILTAPKKGEAPETSKKLPQTRRQFRPMEVLKQPVFWVMYVMFVLVGAGGLLLAAPLALVAKDLNVA